MISQNTAGIPEAYALESGLVQLKQDLHSGCQTHRLDLAPKAALIAAGTVHDPGDIAEVALELFLQDLRGQSVFYFNGQVRACL